MSLALGRKCYVSNWTVTKFCDIGTGDFRFRFLAENGNSFLSAFSFTAENETWIFGQPLYQTILDYTLRQWFSSIQQSRFRTACRCLEKLVLPSISDTSHHSSSSPSLASSSSRSPSEPLRRSVTPGDLKSPQIWDLCSHCNFKTYANVSHVNKTVTDFFLGGGLLIFGGIYTDIYPWRCSPAGHCLSAFVCIHHQTQSIMCWYSRAQACNMAKQR